MDGWMEGGRPTTWNPNRSIVCRKANRAARPRAHPPDAPLLSPPYKRSPARSLLPRHHHHQPSPRSSLSHTQTHRVERGSCQPALAERNPWAARNGVGEAAGGGEGGRLQPHGGRVRRRVGPAGRRRAREAHG
jgi:hypothetical protein